MKEQVLVSVSGGRTSAVLAKLVKDKEKLTPVNVYRASGKIHYTKYVNDTHEYIFVFANTSREHEKTLKFLKNIEKYWGIRIVWLEALVHQGRIGTTHTITSYNKAKRDGSIFESVISKYGIPNSAFLHCTRELKAQAIKSFAKSIGWTDWITYIGYRFDEPKRVNFITAEKNKQAYPLYTWMIVKEDVLSFMKRQPFDLDLQEWEGNCKLCHKKSKRKLLTQISCDPNSAEWVKDMEYKYRYFKKDGRSNDTIKNGTLFFRNNESIHDLIEESKEPFQMSVDIEKRQTKLFDIEFDEQEDCAESCEPLITSYEQR